MTPLPQSGNPRPRVFRLDRDEARDQPAGLQQRGRRRRAAPARRARQQGGIVGVNIGANRDSADRIADYVRLIETFAPVVSYFSVNISSPNTPGLRDLQQGRASTNCWRA